MQISGVVILYHSDEEQVIRNIQSYLDYLNQLIVFANSDCRKIFVERMKTLSPKIIFIANPQNEGIAKPLNKALQIAGNQNQWLLTMDQDSSFNPAQVTAYFKAFNRHFYRTKDVAIVCPNHTAQKQSTTNDEYKETIRAITSGSIINTKICQKLGGFDEKLFIDDVDLEYCYRCVVTGYKIIQFPNIFLNHALGTQKQAGYFSVFKKSGRSLHSPFRIYFMVRNFLYVSLKYKKYLPQEIKQRRKGLLVMLKNNLLFSGKFFAVLVAAIKGYLHFKFNKFSS